MDIETIYNTTRGFIAKIRYVIENGKAYPQFYETGPGPEFKVCVDSVIRGGVTKKNFIIVIPKNPKLSRPMAYRLKGRRIVEDFPIIFILTKAGTVLAKEAKTENHLSLDVEKEV